MKKLLLVVYCLLFANLNAEIFEVRNIKDLKSYVKNKQTLVLFDIDNTVLEPANPYDGSDQWFSAVLKRDMDNGKSSDDAFKIQFPIFLNLIKKAEFQKVEEDSLNVINSLKELNVETLALTARSEPLIDDTHKLLKDNNILPTLSNLAENRVLLLDGKIKSKAFYFKGTIHCANNNKGECLKKFLELFSSEKLELKDIQEIILIDDKEKNLKDVEDFFKDSKIRFTGLRYSYLDEKVKSFVLKDEYKVN